MELDIHDYLWQLYHLALGRDPDPNGFEAYKRALCSGATKEAIAYIACTSKEFANRAQVIHLEEYKKAYERYHIRDVVRRMPVIGWVWAIAATPKRLYRLEVDERVRDADRLLQERQLRDTLSSQNASLQSRIIAFTPENIENFEHISSKLDELSTLFESLLRQSIAQVDLIQAQSKAQFNLLQRQSTSQFNTLQNQSIKQLNIFQNHLDSHNSEIRTKLESLNTLIDGLGIRQTAEIIPEIQLANQNITHANVKLDETEVLINNTAAQNKPIVYGLPGGITVVRTKDYTLGVPSEEWRLAVFLNTYGAFEFGTEEYFRSIIKEGMNVVDIGANLGIYTLHALSAGCYVYSYEPTPKIYNILLDNIGINGFEPTGRATVYNLAVSDSMGKVEFTVYENRNGHNTFFPTSNDDNKITVNTVCLDQHLAHLDHIDVVKIDVEGAEPLVFKGMKEIITNNPGIQIIMEFAPSHLLRGGNDPQSFLEIIHATGLIIHLIDEQTGKISEINDEQLCKTYSANILLSKPTQQNQ
jgi:FkbM family methyltransferase